MAGNDADEVGTDIVADVHGSSDQKNRGEHKNDDISGTVSWIDLKHAQHLPEHWQWCQGHNDVTTWCQQ